MPCVYVSVSVCRVVAGHGVFAGDAKHGLSWAAMPAWTELGWLLVVWHVAFDTYEAWGKNLS